MHYYGWDMHGLFAGVLQATLNNLSYAIMWRHAERQMAVERPVIVDCPLARKELFDHGSNMAMKVSTAMGCIFRDKWDGHGLSAWCLSATQ